MAGELSRGQKKILIYLLQLSAERVSQKFTARKAVVLLDDFSSELDPGSKNALMEILGPLGCQVLVSGINPDEPNPQWIGRCSMFHVEQGSVYDVLPLQAKQGKLPTETI